MRMVFRIILAALTVAALGASAEVLYKLIDKSGKVTYSESKPERFEGQVIRIDLDSKTNAMAAPKAPVAGAGVETENEKIIRRRIVTKPDLIQAARAKVEAARKAYEDARDNPGAGDLDWIARGANPLGIAQGGAQKPPPSTIDTGPKNPQAPQLPQSGQRITGARPVPTDAYTARLEGLEKAWHDAEEELRILEQKS